VSGVEYVRCERGLMILSSSLLTTMRDVYPLLIEMALISSWPTSDGISPNRGVFLYNRPTKHITKLHIQSFYSSLDFVRNNPGEPVQKAHFAIFWIFWCKMKITKADAPTIRMDSHPSRLIGAPISATPTIFTPDALPDTTLPIYPGLGQAPNMLACIPGGLVITKLIGP